MFTRQTKFPVAAVALLQKHPTNFNPETLTLVGCTYTNSGNQGMVTFTVRPEPIFESFPENDISVAVKDHAGNLASWTNYDLNFSSVSSLLGVSFTAPSVDMIYAGENYDVGIILGEGSTQPFSFDIPHGATGLQVTQVTGPVTVALQQGSQIGLGGSAGYSGSATVNDHFREEDLLVSLSCAEGNGSIAGDDSGNGHHGAISGAVWSSGQEGPVLLFDGINDYVNLGNDSQLDMTHAVTLSAWVNPTVLQKGHIISKEGTYKMSIEDDGTLVALFATADGWGSNIVSSDMPLTAGVWSRVSVTYSAATGEVVLYIDGEVHGTATKSGNIVTNTQELTVGIRDNDAMAFPFKGQIGEVEIHSRALSAEEVLAAMDGEYPFVADMEFTADGETFSFSVSGRAKVVGLQMWSDPNTWGGSVPNANTQVVINQGQTVYLDVDADVRNITVNGQLIAMQDRDLNLSARWIMVEGSGALFQWGTAADPYLRRGTITLKHFPSDSIPNVGSKFIAARNNAQVEIHGEEKLSWTQLNDTADEGATQITVEGPIDWEINDQIVIASTDFDAHQAEVRTIDSINGNTLTLNQPLNYTHWGALQTYNNGSRNFTLDERAEVGLLSRNITIQGDAQSENNGFGGHTMFMPSATVHFSGVELYRMGQKGELARVPVPLGTWPEMFQVNI